MRDPKIEALRRQINVLIEATNRFQLQLKGEDGTEHGETFIRALLIENQMSRKAQFTVANARTNGAALGFSMTWNQPFKKVEEGSSAANHNSTTKAAAKNQPGSWYTLDVNKVVAEDLRTGADTPRSNCYLINGQPGDLLPCSRESTYRWVVDYGKTYLVRIVNAAMNAELYFAIANHSLTVVGMDGNYVKPIISDYIMISPGQTMNVLLTANQSLSHYYIETRQYDTARPDVTDYDQTNVTAILMYSGNYTAPDSPLFPSSLPSYEDSLSANRFLDRLRSLASKEHPVNVPVNVTTKMYITVSMNQLLCPNASCDGIDGNRLVSSLNNISFENPSTDILLAYYRNLSGIYTSDFPNWPPSMFNFTQADLPMNTTIPIQGTKAKVLNYNEEVEITFQGTEVLNASENHPLHMHGYSFYVVGSGYGNFNNETDPKTYNLVDPLEVNTVGVPKNGWATIRFKASNPVLVSTAFIRTEDMTGDAWLSLKAIWYESFGDADRVYERTRDRYDPYPGLLINIDTEDPVLEHTSSLGH
nr:laccase-14 [Quercus suber]